MAREADPATWVIALPDLTATEDVGRSLGQHLHPGDVLALIGPLGAGKTHLTRAIAEGLNVLNPILVNSPTFVLLQEYSARIPIYHFDTYRLQNDREFLDLGADEYLQGDGVCIIEWADRVQDTLPADHLRLTLAIVDVGSRTLTIEPRGPRARDVCHNWFGTLPPHLIAVAKSPGHPR